MNIDNFIYYQANNDKYDMLSYGNIILLMGMSHYQYKNTVSGLSKVPRECISDSHLLVVQKDTWKYRMFRCRKI